MFLHFTPGGREVVNGGSFVARELGASTVEAEHLLLAASRYREPVVAVLHDAGLDFAGLQRALAAEREHTLAAVGVSGGAPSFTPFPDAPVYATSAKLALERALRAARAERSKEITIRHILLGILRAQLGTVPRALDCAGVDRIALVTRLEGLA